MTFDIKMLVIACNTATAVALNHLQSLLPIPVIGVIEPGARTAIMTTKNQNVLILGTEGTIKSEAYRHHIKNINPNVEVSGVACPGFVPLVEKCVTRIQLLQVLLCIKHLNNGVIVMRIRLFLDVRIIHYYISQSMNILVVKRLSFHLV